MGGGVGGVLGRGSVVDTLHLVQSPNIVRECQRRFPRSRRRRQLRHRHRLRRRRRQLQLCIEVCTQSVKYFGHPSGTTSFRLCRCQLDEDENEDEDEDEDESTLRRLLWALQCFSLAMHIFPFFNLLPLPARCFLSLSLPYPFPSSFRLRCPGLAEGKLFGVSSAAHQFLLLTSKSCNSLSPGNAKNLPPPPPSTFPVLPLTHTHTPWQWECYSTIGSLAVLPAVC